MVEKIIPLCNSSSRGVSACQSARQGAKTRAHSRHSRGDAVISQEKTWKNGNIQGISHGILGLSRISMHLYGLKIGFIQVHLMVSINVGKTEDSPSSTSPWVV